MGREKKPRKKCAVNWCDSDSYCKTYCRKHYRKFQRYGDPLGTAEPKREEKKKEKYYETKEFISLFDKWNELLEKDDKTNAEMHIPKEPPAYCPSIRRASYTDKTKSAAESIAHYYRVANKVLHHGIFHAPINKKPDEFFYPKNLRKIWKMHATGLTAREITNKCKLPEIKLWKVRKAIYYIQDVIMKNYIEREFKKNEQELE